MKNVINLIIIYGCLFLMDLLFAQDINEIYNQAKEALMEGDYNEALLKVNGARTLIMVDPNLDPNEVYLTNCYLK